MTSTPPLTHESIAYTTTATIAEGRAGQPSRFVGELVRPVGLDAPARAHTSRGARGVDTLAAESELLGAAHRAVNGGDASRALTLLESYRDRFPHGVLREERDVEVVLVLCRLGRRDEARAAAERFLRAHRHSPLAHRVETSCAGLSSDDLRVDAPTRR